MSPLSLRWLNPSCAVGQPSAVHRAPSGRSTADMRPESGPILATVLTAGAARRMSGPILARVLTAGASHHLSGPIRERGGG